jgi:4'-phosphopantetheinyl transferase
MEFKNLQNKLHIWPVNLDGWELQDNEIVRKLPESEREKSERFRSATIRARYVKRRFLLRVLLGKYAGTDFCDQEFSLTQYGKPQLKSAEDQIPLFFNVSNSDNICLYAFTEAGEVGIDIEKIYDLSDMGRIVERFFSPLEQKAFCALPERDRKQTFFRYWTRKEALLKAMGVGLSFPLNKVDVITDISEEPSEVCVKIHEGNVETEWTLQDINVFEGFASAVALEGNHRDHSMCRRYFQLDDSLSDNERLRRI